jgi:hypothetical protein
MKKKSNEKETAVSDDVQIELFSTLRRKAIKAQ